MTRSGNCPLCHADERMDADVVIERGEIVVYRLLDVADAIDLKRVDELLRSTRLQLRPRGHAFIVKNAPVLVPVGSDDLDIGSRAVRSETFARVFDYGVVSLS